MDSCTWTHQRSSASKKIKWKADLELATELAVDHECDGETSCSGSPWNGLQRPQNRLRELEIRGRIETIQTTAVLRILRNVLEIWGEFGYSDASEKLLIITMKTSQRVKYIIEKKNFWPKERGYIYIYIYIYKRKKERKKEYINWWVWR